MPRHKGSGVTFQLSIKVDAYLWEYIQSEAARKNESVASVVRRMLIRSQYTDTVFCLTGFVSTLQGQMSDIHDRLAKHEAVFEEIGRDRHRMLQAASLSEKIIKGGKNLTHIREELREEAAEARRRR